MKGFRVVLYASQVMFKGQPPALQDPYAKIARDFDATVPTETAGVISQIVLAEEKMQVTIGSDRAFIRVENPADDDEAIAKSLAAWQKLQDRLQLGEILVFSCRAIFVADRTDESLATLLRQWRAIALPKSPLLDQASNAGLIITATRSGRQQRIQFGPATREHLMASHQLTVDEPIFYYADVDDVLAKNAQFGSTVRRAEMSLSLRDARAYAEEILSAFEGNAGEEAAADGSGDRGGSPGGDSD